MVMGFVGHGLTFKRTSRLYYVLWAFWHFDCIDIVEDFISKLTIKKNIRNDKHDKPIWNKIINDHNKNKYIIIQ